MAKNQIYIEKNETLYSLLEKMQTCILNEEKHLYLIPKEKNCFLLKHGFFLEYLTRHFKYVQIIVIGEHFSTPLGKKLGIQYQESEKKAKENIISHNYSTKEYLLYEVEQKTKRIQKYIFSSLLALFIKIKNILPLGIFWGIILGIFFFFWIQYLGIPHASIYITPETIFNSISRNVVFTETPEEILGEQKVIPVTKIEENFLVSQKFNISTIDDKTGERSHGDIEIYNSTDEEMQLRPNTRFLQEDGIIYRTTDWVTLPKQEDGEPSVTITYVEADIKDIHGEFIGKRWNIKKWSFLWIPGLVEFKTKVFAKTIEDFQWGTNKKNFIFTQKEYKKFQQLFEKKIQLDAKKRIDQKAKIFSEKNISDFQIIPISQAIFISNEDIETDKIFGELGEEVTLFAEVHVHAYMYQPDALISYLNEITRKYNFPHIYTLEKLADSLEVSQIISLEPDPFIAKVTITGYNSYTYNFTHPKNIWAQRMKKEIAGMSKEDAYIYFINHPTVSQVTIKLTPLGTTNIPLNIDNIDFTTP